MKGIAEVSLLAGGGNHVCLSLFNTWSNNTQPAITHTSKSVIVFPPLLRILLTIFFSNRRHKQLGKIHCAQFIYLFIFLNLYFYIYRGFQSPSSPLILDHMTLISAQLGKNRYIQEVLNKSIGLYLHGVIISSLLHMQMKCVHHTHIWPTSLGSDLLGVMEVGLPHDWTGQRWLKCSAVMPCLCNALCLAASSETFH